jgi:hypothetical protein
MSVANKLHSPKPHRSNLVKIDSSESTAAGTRKMVNYARAGRSQEKFWWRLDTVLTCKSIV